VSHGTTDPSEGAHPRVARIALRRFAISSVVALIVLGVVSVLAADRVARTDALRDARIQTEGLAGAVANQVTTDLRNGEEGSADTLEAIIGPQLREGSLRHVKVWSDDGTVIWSDQSELIGQSFALPDDVQELLGTSAAVADISDVDLAENVAEREEGQLLEVYVGAEDADGEDVVVEAYLSTEPLDRERQTLLTALLPVTVGGLLIFQLAVLPLALALARRVERGQQEQARLTRHALLASDLERRRIAQDLHDGVIQDLAGLAYALPLVETGEADRSGRRKGTLSLDRAHQVLVDCVAALRRLITDSYPPDLESDGLANALADLASATENDRLTVTVDVTSNGAVKGEAARLAYRVVREGLRNVARHADADNAVVRVQMEGREVIVQVEDDGVGLPPGEVPEGHLGLRLLSDTLNDVGGSVRAVPAESGGTLLEARYPADHI
jgi:signal transduction histidine kinase